MAPLDPADPAADILTEPAHSDFNNDSVALLGALWISGGTHMGSEGLRIIPRRSVFASTALTQARRLLMRLASTTITTTVAILPTATVAAAPQG